MRVTVSHNKPKQQVKGAVDHSMGQLFGGIGSGLVEFSEHHREWNGDTLAFSLVAKMGFIRSPLKGTVFVTDTDLTVDLDLGLLDKLIPQETVRNHIQGRIAGLLT